MIGLVFVILRRSEGSPIRWPRYLSLPSALWIRDDMQPMVVDGISTKVVRF